MTKQELLQSILKTIGEFSELVPLVKDAGADSSSLETLSAQIREEAEMARRLL